MHSGRQRLENEDSSDGKESAGSNGGKNKGGSGPNSKSHSETGMGNEHSGDDKKTRRRLKEEGPSNEFKERMSLKSSQLNTHSNYSTEPSDDEEELTAWQKSLKFLGKVVESRVFEIFTIIITIQSMFSDDIRIALAPLLFDVIYNVIVILNILMFVFEITVSSFGKKDYFLTFYFFTDIIATFTLVFDFGFLFDMIAGITNFSADNATDVYSFAKDGKHIRKGTKAFSLQRIIRLIKLLRIIKLYKHIHKI